MKFMNLKFIVINYIEIKYLYCCIWTVLLFFMIFKTWGKFVANISYQICTIFISFLNYISYLNFWSFQNYDLGSEPIL